MLPLPSLAQQSVFLGRPVALSDTLDQLGQKKFRLLKWGRQAPALSSNLTIGPLAALPSRINED